MQKNKKALGIGFLLLLIGTVSFLYWAGKKQVWFLDEIYTYESANGFEQTWPTASVDEWMSGKDSGYSRSAGYVRMSGGGSSTVMMLCMAWVFMPCHLS